MIYDLKFVVMYLFFEFSSEIAGAGLPLLYAPLIKIRQRFFRPYCTNMNFISVDV